MVCGAAPVFNLSLVWLNFTGGKHSIVLQTAIEFCRAAAVMCLTFWQFYIKKNTRIGNLSVMVGKECPAEEINCLTGAGWRQV